MPPVRTRNTPEATSGESVRGAGVGALVPVSPTCFLRMPVQRPKDKLTFHFGSGLACPRCMTNISLRRQPGTNLENQEFNNDPRLKR